MNLKTQTLQYSGNIYLYTIDDKKLIDNILLNVVKVLKISTGYNKKKYIITLNKVDINFLKTIINSLRRVTHSS